MRQRPIRCILRYTETGKPPVDRTKESVFTMTEEPIHITIEPQTGKCTVTIGTQTESDSLPLPVGYTMTITWPHSGMMMYFGGEGNPTPVFLKLVPPTARVMGLITDAGHGNMEVHLVEVQLSFHGLILETIPGFDQLEKLEIIIEPI
jgi:hypothetical protein